MRGLLEEFPPLIDALTANMLLMSRRDQLTAEIATYVSDAQRTLPANPGLSDR
jgi:lipopolysaccharide/colanic/teichoic acid biosynthesis glycosyltransferase